LTLGKAQSLRVLAEPLRLRFRASLRPNGEILLEQPASTGERAMVSGADATWAFADATFRPVQVPPQMMGSLGSRLIIPRSQVPAFLSQVWPVLGETQDVQADFSIDQFELAPRRPQFHLHLAGGLARLEARLQCAYGPRIMTLGVTQSEEQTWLADPDHPTRYSTRDAASERAAVTRLQRSGFQGPDMQGKWLLVGETPVLTFLAREFPRLESIWTVTLEANLSRSTQQKVERIEPTMRITTSGERWFDVDIEYAASGGERFSAAEMQRLILSGQSHTRLRSGAGRRALPDRSDPIRLS
jgi:Bacterial SNF2 helicase associated